MAVEYPRLYRFAELKAIPVGSGCSGSASIGKSELEGYGVGGLVLSFDFSSVPGLGEFLVTVGKDGLFFAEMFVLRGDVSDGGV